MSEVERKQSVQDILKDMRGLDGLKRLFWQELNYERENKPLSTRQWPDSAKNALAEDPILFASGGEGNAFHVVYCRLASPELKRGLERQVVNQLMRDHPYALFVFSNMDHSVWHFLNVKYEQDVKQRRLLRRIAVGPDERLRTAAERLSMVDLSQIDGDLFSLSPLAIQQRHDEAFDVEAVTKQFFIEYRSVFQLLQDDLTRQTKDKGWAHDYALQFLNRCMFLYFIQRKRWLGQDNEFLYTFWKAYKESKGPADTFFSKWLKVLFFDAFNRKGTAHHRHLPENIRAILATAPYLNGGLFTPNGLDDEDRHSFVVSDARFAQVFKFLERYNFTIIEDSPLDQEVAVDPEMIGKVYESLVNVSSEADERGDVGIFYTPRTEIDLMCRLALVDQLSNHVGDKHRNLFYEVVFAIEPDEKLTADAAVAKEGLWPAVTETLRSLAVVDPACGSGSFLVGMLYILDDLQNRAQAHGVAKESAFDRRKRIIGQNLYGVDVMDWACHVAELRLWLALVVDAEFSQAELSIRKEPLLPHFTFKIRQGDSLVQEVGGVNLGRLHTSRDIKPALKARITAFKHEKLTFYQNTPDRKYRTADQIRQEERRLFRDILDAHVDAIEAEIKSNRQWLDGKTANLFGEQVAADAKLDSAKQRAVFEAKTRELSMALEKARAARAALKTVQNVPFVWDIAFVEVFEDEKGGFDIVIGNPPYVRKENIADPSIPRDKITPENKREYKDKLLAAVYQAFPRFFCVDSATKSVRRKLDAQADLFIYFHFVGLSLLAQHGSFSFICSNSWLDVGYGADLQEFLLRHSHVKHILDNQQKRSFASADINTVICLFSAPDESSDVGFRQTARFTMFRVPFEQVLSAIVMEEIEQCNMPTATEEYRAFPLSQRTLFEDGCDVSQAVQPERERPFVREPRVDYGSRLRTETYIGNKWGGKYLRAPDIYWRLVRQAKGALVKLGSLCEVEGYIHDNNTGSAYPKVRFVKSVRDLHRILVEPVDDGVVSYGVKQEGNSRLIAPILFPRTFGTRHLIPFNEANAFFKEFYKILPKTPKDALVIVAQLNSTMGVLQRELIGLVNLGDGALKFSGDDVKQFLIAPSVAEETIRGPFRRMATRKVLDYVEELEQEDRRELDSIIFAAIGANKKDQEAVYSAVRALIDARVNKATSLDTKQIKKRQKAADSLRGIECPQSRHQPLADNQTPSEGHEDGEGVVRTNGGRLASPRVYEPP